MTGERIDADTLTDLGERLVAVRRAIAEGDLDAVSAVAHRARGAAQVLSLDTLAVSLAAFEAALEAGAADTDAGQRALRVAEDALARRGRGAAARPAA